MIKCEKKIPSKEELWNKYYTGAPEQQRIRRAIQNSKESIAKLSLYLVICFNIDKINCVFFLIN
jgi:hypothetical protein